MFKRIGLLAVILSLFLASVAEAFPGLDLAASEIKIASGSAVVQFPLAITFNLGVTGDANITDIRLHFTVERDSFVKVITEEKLSFTPATNVTTSYNWDMRQSGGIPTGTAVDYFWSITDSTGKTVITGKQTVVFDDARFAWHSLAGNNINLHWYSGDTSLAQTLVNTAQAGLANLEKNTGAKLSRPVSIYVYASTGDMQGAMIFAQDWTGGATYPAYSTIVIGINASNLVWGEGALVHELTHMVNYQMTSNPYSGLPTWLDEGLAMYSQGALDSTFEASLVAALSRGSLFSVRAMASPFSTDAALSYQEYAQSYSLIDFLISAYGQTKMAALLDAFHQGNTYDGALNKVYGFDTDGLNKLWLPFANNKYLSRTGAST
jgi:hypothetical protein